MKRRLTFAILGTAALALLLAGVGTLLLARVGARQSAEEELRNQAESTANLLDISQTRSGLLTVADSEALRALLCRDSGTSTGSPGTVPDREVERLRASVCAPSVDAAVSTARRQLCETGGTRADAGTAEDVRAAIETFCREPSATTLDGLRGTYCQAAEERIASGSVPTAAARRRTEQLRINLCRLVTNRNQARQSLQTALSKERIDLLVFDEQNTLVQGDPPAGVSSAALDPQALRAGESVSGTVGNGAWAVAAVDPAATTMSAILISRPSDPVAGIVPWFLLASGVTLLIGLGVAASLSRALTKPLLEAKTVTAQIADGDLSVRVPEHVVRPGQTRDELDDLAHSINAMAEALERSRGLERQFLLSVSHDLRTPLTSIRGYAEAIADGAAPDPRGAAGIIMAESRRLERLVQDLLDLAKLDARRFSFHVIPVDLVEVASDSVDGFRREVEALGLHISLDAPTVPVTVSTDPDRLQQVIANLIENALKFATSTITVRVTNDAGVPRVEVADDGPGIDAADLPHVFERLYVAAAAPQRKEIGSGLGLAIVREMIEAMGGRVDALAGPTGGTRLVLTLSPAPPTEVVPAPETI